MPTDETATCRPAARGWPVSLRDRRHGAMIVGITFVDSRIGVLTFVLAYLSYGICATLLTRKRGPLAMVGWVLVIPVVGGLLLGTFGALGLALGMGTYIPYGGGALGTRHRYVVTTYGNATTAEEGSVVTIYRRLPLARFVERRVFQTRYSFDDVEIGSVYVTTDPADAARVMIKSHDVTLAIVRLH
jgi:hypothetical protein